MIQWLSRVDSTPQLILECAKTKRHIKTFHRYFDSLSQQGSCLLVITSIVVVPWIFITSIEVVPWTSWWASIMHRRNIGNQADLQKLSRLWILKMEVESPMWLQWHNTRTAHRAKINDWIYQIGYTLQRADII
jgi:hypothetical protein